MDHLGLTNAQLRAYHRTILTSHDVRLDIDVLSLNEELRGTVAIGDVREQRTGFIDGQVNIQRDGHIKRTATLNLFDPARTLNLDGDSPASGAMFADRMVRVKVGVNVTGIGTVWATPFVGPVDKVTREGDTITVTCVEKTVLAMEGRPPKTVKSGMNAVEAIREIMQDRTGERRFRFPKGIRKRLTRSYSVGWKTEASPWEVVQKIARNELGMQLVYACDGALLLRKKPTAAVFDFHEATALTGAPRSEYDKSNVRNIVRVAGLTNKKKDIKIAAVAKAKPGHSMSPERLARHGVPGYLPLIIEDSSIKKQKDAQARADRELAGVLPMGVRASFPGVPIYHFDYSDPVRITSDWGNAIVPFVEGSLPLGLGGDATYGSQRQVSKPARRYR